MAGTQVCTRMRTEHGVTHVLGRSTNFQAYACAARAVGGVRVQTGCARVCVWTWIAKLNLPEASQNHFFPRIFFSKKDWNMMYAWKM